MWKYVESVFVSLFVAFQIGVCNLPLLAGPNETPHGGWDDEAKMRKPIHRIRIMW